MSAANPLNIVAGFQEAMASKQRLSETGSDFLAEKGQVSQSINQLHPKRLHLVVSEIVAETPSTSTIRLVKSGGGDLPPFLAGQYINLFIEIDGVLTARPYAISSSPTIRQYYDLTVKRAPGGFVSPYILDRLLPGRELLSSGPMGTFHHNPIHHGDDLVFLAGGSGSAPARSMILDILECDKPFHFHMIYVNSHADDVIYASQLRELATAHPNFTLTEVITRPPAGYQGRTGRLTQEALSELVGLIGNKYFYVCGPTPFNESCEQQLRALGVKPGRIKIEANGAPKCPSKLPKWPEGVAEEKVVTVTVKGRGQFQTPSGEPLLNSLERNGYFVENACRSGECSLCRVKLVSGEVFNPPEAHLRKSDAHFGWIYSCVAYPTQDIEIDF